MKQIIVFEQDNCGWCTRLHPHIKMLAEESGIELSFVNITNDWDAPYEFGVKNIRSTPTVAIFKHGQFLDSFSIDSSGISGIISRVRGFING